MRTTRLERRLRGDSGVTLVETLVVMILLAVVSTMVTRAVIDSHKVVRIIDDQTTGLSDVRVASERLGRDIREARSVVCNPVGTLASVIAAVGGAGPLDALSVFRLIDGLNLVPIDVPIGATADVDTWDDAHRLGVSIPRPPKNDQGRHHE